MTSVPERRADPCTYCGGDHTELRCLVRRSRMGWLADHVEEHDEAMIEILKARWDELDLAAYIKPGDLEDLVNVYYWIADHLGEKLATEISRAAELDMVERRVP